MHIVCPIHAKERMEQRRITEEQVEKTISNPDIKLPTLHKLITASFLGFAGGRTIFSLIGGKLIDRFSAMRIFPFYLIPFAFGLGVLSIFSYSFLAPVYLILTGISMGLSGPLKTALLAEVYGTLNLGSIRAALASVSVFSTALSPALFGFLLDSGFTFTFISAGLAFVVLAVVFISRYLPSLQKV